MTFTPALTLEGEPCKSCISIGEFCSKHSEVERTPQPTNYGIWRPAYLKALSKGFSKRSSAGLAKVTPNTVFRHQREDPAFAEQVQVAFDRGTAHLEKIALDIVEDEKPDIGLLKHMLAFRGIQPKTQVEVTGKDGGPIQTQAPIPFGLLSAGLKAQIISEVEALESGTPLQIEGEGGAERGGGSPDQDPSIIDVDFKEVEEIERGGGSSEKGSRIVGIPIADPDPDE